MHQSFQNDLAKIIQRNPTSRRYDILLNSLINAVDSNNSNKYTENRADSIQRLENKPQIVPQILFLTNIGMVSEDNLLWINNTERQPHWIFKYLTSSLPHPPIPITYPIIANHIARKEKSIAYIDYYFAQSIARNSLPNPYATLQDIQQKWDAQEENDKILEWTKQENEAEIIDFIWWWMGKRYPHAINLFSKFRNHDQLLLFFDQSTDPSLKELVAREARKAWTQKIRRLRTDKKQVNFILSTETCLKLEKIASQNRISKNEVIDTLINAENLNGIYISNRLKSLLKIKQ